MIPFVPFLLFILFFQTTSASEHYGTAALAIVVVKECFAFVKDKKNGKNGNGGKKAGDLDPIFWQSDNRAALRETVVPILEKQTEILNRMDKTLLLLADRTTRGEVGLNG